VTRGAQPVAVNSAIVWSDAENVVTENVVTVSVRCSFRQRRFANAGACRTLPVNQNQRDKAGTVYDEDSLPEGRRRRVPDILLGQAGFSTITCFMHEDHPGCYSDARSARSAYSRRRQPGGSHRRTSEPPVSPRPPCQEDLGYGRTSNWGCG